MSVASDFGIWQRFNFGTLLHESIDIDFTEVYGKYRYDNSIL